MTTNKGQLVTSTIVPAHELDTYATHDSIYGKGGWREVKTLAERDAIPMERRRQGMVVYVQENFTAYLLNNGTVNGCFIPLMPTIPTELVNHLMSTGVLNLPELEPYAKKIWVEEQLKDTVKTEDIEDNLTHLMDSIKEWVESKKYLTEHQPLDDYIKITEVEELLENYYTSETIDEMFSKYITEEVCNERFLSKATAEETYLKKDEFNEDRLTLSGTILGLDTRIQHIEETYVNSSEMDDKGYITEAKAREIIEGYNFLVEDILVELGYKTAEDLLEDFATKADLEKKLKEIMTKDDLKGYATEAFVVDKVKNLVAVDKIGDYLQGYATEAFVTDRTRNFVTQEQILDYLNGYATGDDLDNKVGDAATKEDLKGYATKAFVSDKVENLVSKNEINSYFRGYATEAYVADKVKNTVTQKQLNDRLTELNLGNATNGITQDDIKNFITDDEVDEKIENLVSITDIVRLLKGYATEAWVADKVKDTVTQKQLADILGGQTPGEIATGGLTAEDIKNFVTNDEVDKKLTALVAKKDIPGYFKGYATESFVTDKLKVLQDALANVGKGDADDSEISLDLTGLASKVWVSEQDFATCSWVESQNYLQAGMLKGYATEAFVVDRIKNGTSQPVKGAATETWVAEYVSNALSGISVDGVITDYKLLTNKPVINGVQLIGDISLEDLGLISKEVHNTEIAALEAKIVDLTSKLETLTVLVDEHLNPKGATVITDVSGDLTLGNLEVIEDDDAGNITVEGEDWEPVDIEIV